MPKKNRDKPLKRQLFYGGNLRHLGASAIALIELATIYSVMVGIFFGFYPARKAAGLDPIQALRHE